MMNDIHNTMTNLRESLLFQLKEIDEPDELEVILRQNYQHLRELITGASENEINFTLMSKVSESMDNHMEVTLGLLYGILVEPNQSLTYLGYLNAIVRDNFSVLTTHMKRLANEKYHKMLDPCREQLVWLVSELVRQSVPEADALCGFMLRNIIGGNVSPRNIWLAQTMLQLLSSNKDWLYSNNSLIPVVLYTYLRIIVDHTKTQFLPLREQEAEFCVMLMREKFADCMIIGRDLIRALQDVAKLPEMEAIWKDLITNPTSLCPHLTSFAQLLRIPTPKTYLQSRISPEMETHIMFLMREVKMGQQKRYQQWFMLRHLPAPESETLLPDLVRFICGVYHPPNHVICSDIIPRWAVIGWLLKSAKTDYMISQIKLALFYDWLYFDPKTDNIMNIEPGILLMLGSIPKYTDVTAGLLEFLLIIMEVFDPPRKDLILRGVHNSFRTILDKGVVNNVDALFSSTYVHTTVLEKAKVLLAPFYKSSTSKTQQRFNPDINPFQSLPVTPTPFSSPSTSSSSPYSSPPPPPTSSSSSSSSSLQPPPPLSPQQPQLLQPPYQRPQFPGLHFPEKPEHKEGESRPWWPTEEYLILKGTEIKHEVSNGVKKEETAPVPPPAMDEDKQIEWDGVEDEPLGIVEEEEDAKMEETTPFVPPPSSPPTSFNHLVPSPTTQTAPPSFTPPSSSTPSPSFTPPPSSSPPSSPPPLPLSAPSFPPTDSLASIAPDSSFARENIEKTLPTILDTFEKMNPTPGQQTALSNYLTSLLINEPLPSSPSSSLFDFSSSSFYHILFRAVFSLSLPLSSSSPSPTFSLLRTLYKNCASLGFRALCFLSGTPRAKFPNLEVAGFRYALYVAFACSPHEGEPNRENVTVTLLEDCKKLIAADTHAFYTLVPYLFKEFPYLSGNPDLVYLVVSNLDPASSYTLSTLLILQELILFGGNPLVIIEKSLGWESYEQAAAWHLLNNELSRPSSFDLLDSFVPHVLSAIDPSSHREALAGLLQLLRFHPPSRSLLSSVFSFSSKSDIKEEEKEEKATEKGEEEGEKRTDNEAFALCVLEGWCGKGKEVEVSEWICEIMGNSEKVEDLARFLEKWKKAVNLGRISGIFHLEHFQKTISQILLSRSLSHLFPLLLDTNSPASTHAHANVSAQTHSQAHAPAKAKNANAQNPIKIKPKTSSPPPPPPLSPPPSLSPVPSPLPSSSSSNPPLPLTSSPSSSPSPSPTHSTSSTSTSSPFSPSPSSPLSPSLSLTPSLSSTNGNIKEEKEGEEVEKKVQTTKGRRGRKKKEEVGGGEEESKKERKSVKRRLSEEGEDGQKGEEEEEGEEEGDAEVTTRRSKRTNGGKKRKEEKEGGEEEEGGGRQTRSSARKQVITRTQPKRAPSKK